MINHGQATDGTSWTLPPLGGNSSSTAAGTTPGSFARPPQIAPGSEGRWTWSSPDTPGMPQPSLKTAWDFMPASWTLQPGYESSYEQAAAWQPPAGFTHADVLMEAHKIRVARGDYNIAEIHLADAIEGLVLRSRDSLSDDRGPGNPYRSRESG